MVLVKWWLMCCPFRGMEGVLCYIGSGKLLRVKFFVMDEVWGRFSFWQ